MEFKDKYNLLFASTPIPDLFFTDYLSDLDPVCVKVYLMSLYFTKTGRKLTNEEFAAELQISSQELNEKLVLLEAAELIFVKDGNILIQDLNQKKLERCYKSRTSGAMSGEFTVGRAVMSARAEIIKSISDTFFGGQMPSSWYPEIELWFEKYNFSSEVMYMLFQHCRQSKTITLPYVRKVAENWGENNIQGLDQLEEYLTSYDLYKTEKGKVAKALKLSLPLDSYSEAILRRWFLEYKYDFETVELALKKATSKKNAGLNYFDAIVTTWHNAGLSTKEEVIEYEKARAAKAKPADGKKAASQKDNFETRNYDDDFLSHLYKNMEDEK